MITDYASLSAEIANYMHRVDLDDQIPTFISLAEARIYRDLRLTDMETTYPTPVTATNGIIALPADFIAMRGISYSPNPSRDVKLSAVGRDAAAEWRRASSQPQWYTINGLELEVLPHPGDDVEFTLTYFARPIELDSDVNTTNNILGRYPGLYLYGALYEAATYTRNINLMQIADARWQREKALADADAWDSRFGEAPQIRSV